MSIDPRPLDLPEADSPASASDGAAVTVRRKNGASIGTGRNGANGAGTSNGQATPASAEGLRAATIAPTNGHTDVPAQEEGAPTAAAAATGDLAATSSTTSRGARAPRPRREETLDQKRI